VDKVALISLMIF